MLGRSSLVVLLLTATRIAGAQPMGPELRATYTTGDQRQVAIAAGTLRFDEFRSQRETRVGP